MSRWMLFFGISERHQSILRPVLLSLHDCLWMIEHVYICQPSCCKKYGAANYTHYLLTRTSISFSEHTEQLLLCDSTNTIKVIVAKTNWLYIYLDTDGVFHMEGFLFRYTAGKLQFLNLNC